MLILSYLIIALSVIIMISVLHLMKRKIGIILIALSILLTTIGAIGIGSWIIFNLLDRVPSGW